MKFWNWIKSLFSMPSYRDGLECFVASKHPSNTAEVEYWIQYYQQNIAREWAI